MLDAVFILDEVESGYGTVPVLKQVSLKIYKERVTAIVGPNGSGKSTILLCLYGLLPIWKVKATFWEQSIAELSQRELLSQGAVFLPQGQKIFPHLTVRENIEIGFLNLKKELGDLETRLEPFIEWLPNLPTLLDKPAANLSGGERQIVGLARVFLRDAPVILLDEPSLNLAPELAQKLFEMIRGSADQHNKTVVVVEQNVEAVLQVADDAIIVRNGQIAFTGAAKDLAEGDLTRAFNR